MKDVSYYLSGVIIVLGISIIIVLIVVFTSKGKSNSDSPKPEVYSIVSPVGPYQIAFADALSIARMFDTTATLASLAQITDAQNQGAQWCSTGWLSDGTAAYPMQVESSGCGASGVNILTPPSNLANVTVYGIKPTQEFIISKLSNPLQYGVLPFYLPAVLNDKPIKWSQWS